MLGDMEHLIEIDNALHTALELQVLAHIAGEHEGVWTISEEQDVEGIRNPLDLLVLSGLLERDCDDTGWLNTWRVPNDVWEVLDQYTDVINAVIDTIGEA